MFDLETRVYRLPEELELQVFTSPAHFQAKVEKHFLNPTEPWGRLLKVRFLQQLGRKLRAGDLSELGAAYRRVVEVLDAGVRFAEATPLFVRVVEHVAPPEGPEYRLDVLYLVADRGYRVIAHGGAVRTAFFSPKTPADSNLTLYLEAWRAVKARALTHQYTNEETGERVTNLRVEWFTEATWNECPVPDLFSRPEPTRPAAGGYLPPEAKAWLDAL